MITYSLITPVINHKGKDDILNGDYLSKMDPDEGYRRSSFHPGMAAIASTTPRGEGKEGLPHMVAVEQGPGQVNLGYDSYQDPQDSPAQGHLSYYG